MVENLCAAQSALSHLLMVVAARLVASTQEPPTLLQSSSHPRIAAESTTRRRKARTRVMMWPKVSEASWMGGATPDSRALTLSGQPMRGLEERHRSHRRESLPVSRHLWNLGLIVDQSLAGKYSEFTGYSGFEKFPPRNPTQPPTKCKMEAQSEYSMYTHFIQFSHVWRRLVLCSVGIY